MKKIAIIHTTPATIQNLTELANEMMPEISVMNVLDDSILPDMMQGREVKCVEERWITYARMAELSGADAVLSACSTVGEIAERADSILSIPVFRIDEAMAAEAVESGGRICVYATVNSTLIPTVNLIRRKAGEMGKMCQIEAELVQGAYDALKNGDKAEHDRRILECVTAGLERADVTVLAQASMAGALTVLEMDKQKRVLTSPRSGIMYLKHKLYQE